MVNAFKGFRENENVIMLEYFTRFKDTLFDWDFNIH